MLSIKSTFTAAASRSYGFSALWIAIVLIVLSDDDKRRKNKAQAKDAAAKRPSGPRPF